MALMLLLAMAAAPAGESEVRDVSPDGKCGLRLTELGEGEVALSLVEIKTNRELAALGTLGHPYENDAALVWSGDSGRVAYHSTDRRGGDTAVYFQKGEEFAPVNLPNIRDLPLPSLKENEEVSKTVACGIRPVRWLKSGSLVLAEEIEEDVSLLDKDGSPEESYLVDRTLMVTVGFGPDHKATVERKVERLVRHTE